MLCFGRFGLIFLFIPGTVPALCLGWVWAHLNSRLGTAWPLPFLLILCFWALNLLVFKGKTLLKEAGTAATSITAWSSALPWVLFRNSHANLSGSWVRVPLTQMQLTPKAAFHSSGGAARLKSHCFAFSFGPQDFFKARGFNSSVDFCPLPSAGCAAEAGLSFSIWATLGLRLQNWLFLKGFKPSISSFVNYRDLIFNKSYFGVCF